MLRRKSLTVHDVVVVNTKSALFSVCSNIWLTPSAANVSPSSETNQQLRSCPKLHTITIIANIYYPLTSKFVLFNHCSIKVPNDTLQYSNKLKYSFPFPFSCLNTQLIVLQKKRSQGFTLHIQRVPLNTTESTSHSP